MTRKTVRAGIGISVLITTIVVFVLYFRNHPEVFRSLKSVSWSTVLVLFLLYCLFMLSLAWIQRATLTLCGLALGKKESTLLVSYSSIINFFGPLQSGPAFRAAYLKKKYNVSLKKYTFATLIHYGFYALFSGLFLAAFFLGWIVFIFCIATLIISPFVLKINKFQSFNLKGIIDLAVATLSQVIIISAIFYVELISISPQIQYLQSLVYTGAANFALFVSLTPGAIGFRESFIVFTQKLHEINNNVIAGASVLDRSIYIIFLLLLALLIFGFHANDYLKIGKLGKKLEK